MKRIRIFYISMLLVLNVLSGCSQNADSKADIFQYKNSYVGDNSAVGNIVNQLNHSNELKQISLHTKEQPYGITLEYNDITAKNADKEMKKTIIANATYLFALIQNVDWVTFKFSTNEFTVTKTEVQHWYNNNLDGLENEEDLKNLIKGYLNSEDSVN
ncbi:DUF4825 domain-containing protein [Solibacillus merdavium]|uniref:DUF4825 domain-containing protein n=1 Tax=Solibacillus merdavium TaxID=2762218 RepID=A0ABR8XQ65_9BACL|nr:DUF4825 domain-containing protein [Solibacillus merdavium]MBD8034078.1 DUF4825 domain-containing protein [Solibacillus merdavium]